MNKKDNFVFIKHMIDSINAVEDFSKNLSKEELSVNRLKQSAIVREIEVIGEAAKNLSKEFKDKNNKVVWKDIIGTRDIMIHKYFGVDLDIVWNIINEDLPKLKKQISKIEKSEGLIS